MSVIWVSSHFGGAMDLLIVTLKSIAAMAKSQAATLWICITPIRELIRKCRLSEKAVHCPAQDIARS
jgi:hypothetical protein